MSATYSPAPPRRWYCSFCKRDVILTPPLLAESDEVRQCPICKNNSAVWLQFTPRIRRPVTAPGEPFLKRQPQAEATR